MKIPVSAVALELTSATAISAATHSSLPEFCFAALRLCVRSIHRMIIWQPATLGPASTSDHPNPADTKFDCTHTEASARADPRTSPSACLRTAESASQPA